MTTKILTLQQIYEPIQPQLKAAEVLFVKELDPGTGLMGDLTRYVARMPGKRIRPALAVAAAQLIPSGRKSPRINRAVKVAAAVEMIHTATLLHDDVIDGAALRRGLTTLNAKWGDTLSVLSGDYVYSKAFCLLAELKNDRVLMRMSDTARIVCVGEVSQIQHRNNLHLSMEDYLQIIEFKTASLMAAAAESGALLGGAAWAQAKRCGDFGKYFGLAFQILDDMQDLVGEESALGKSLGTDLGEGQVTLPLIYLRDVAGPKARKILSECFHGNGSSKTNANGNGGSNGHTPEPQKIRDWYAHLQKEAFKHDVPDYCRRAADRYLAKARLALKPFPASPYKDSLLALTDYLVQA